ncbi:Uncharacterised protein [Bordetella ansorpii]|uniref:Uncharacterized protein n=1 Tax=Bordetella ansorpii TaxID=288768 RepID=A0A157RBL8_9BORD|nr:hypothetical protein [Bordetella ansorpii]SAI55276.1 Uncharacterised protein [Bordetella ansorpii]
MSPKTRIPVQGAPQQPHDETVMTMDPLFMTFIQFLGLWLVLMAGVTILGPRIAQLMRQRMLRPVPIPIRQGRPSDRSMS